MSKIKTQKLQARFDDSTLVIGLDGKGHTTRFEGNVILPQYVTNEELADLLAGYNSIYKYITREEFKQNSNKVFIQDAEPKQQNPDDPWEFEPRDGDFWFSSKLENPMVFQTINSVSAWRKPKFAQDIDDLKIDVLEIAGELEALINVSEKGSWTTKAGDIDVDPVGDGQVMFSPDTFTAPTFKIKMSTKDGDGKVHNFAGVDVNETYIEFVQDDSDYLLFRPSSINLDEPGIVIMEGSGEIGKGVASDGEANEVRAFKADVTVDLSTLMPKSGGTFTGPVTHTKDVSIQAPFEEDRFIKVQNLPPKDEEGNAVYDNNFGLQIDLSLGNSNKNQFKITAANETDILIANGGSKSLSYYGMKSSSSNLATQGDLASCRSGETLGSRHGSPYKYTTPRSLNAQQFAMGNPESWATSMYLYKIWNLNNSEQYLYSYATTSASMYEIFEYDTGVVISKGAIVGMGSSQHSGSDRKLTLHKIYTKPGYVFSTNKNYGFYLTNMVRK